MNTLHTRITDADKAFNSYLFKFRKSWLVTASRIVTQMGSSAFLILVCVMILFFQRHLYPLLPYFLVSEIVVLTAVIPLRYLIKRTRPHPANLHRYLLSWNRYSLPSLHASRIFALAMILGFNYSGSIYYMAPAAVLVSFTRLILEKHYLSDILAGSAVGLLAGVVAIQGMRYLA